MSFPLDTPSVNVFFSISRIRSYAQEKPLQAYVNEGFEMFEEMLSKIAGDIVGFCVNVKIEYRQ